MSSVIKKLDGKVALITGAGSGIGKAMALLFSEHGAMVVVADVVVERVNQAVDEIINAGGKAAGLVHDLSSKSEVEKMIDETMSSFGRIDILCNNAGIMDSMKPVAETTDELWERVMNINLNAPFWATRRALPIMIKQKSGVILNTASIAGLFAGKSGTAYSVSKHALIGLTKSTAAGYREGGIRCNAMVVGAAQTAIGMGSAEPSPLGLEVFKKGSAAMPRPADPKEIANLALFLVSGDSSYLNGSCVVIDGGWTVY